MLRTIVNTTFSVVCDISGEELGPFPTRREVLDAANQAGWKQIGNIFIAPGTAADMPVVLSKNQERVKDVAVLPSGPVKVAESLPTGKVTQL